MIRLRNVPVLVVLQNRNFRFLWAARWTHEISRRMELIVLGYLILNLTNSAFAVGLISVFLNGPRPPLALVAGMLADRLDRWRILVGMHIIYLLIASCLLVLLIYQLVEPWHVFLAILLQGTAKVLDDPTRRAALFDLAGQDRIAHAMSLETITNNGGKIMGPIIGGFMVEFYGFAGAFIVLVVLDLVAAFLIFKMRLPEGSAWMVRNTAFWRGIQSGIGHSFSNKFVLGVLTISLVMNGMILPLQYFIPVIATDVLKVGPALGGLLGAADGIGAFRRSHHYWWTFSRYTYPRAIFRHRRAGRGHRRYGGCVVALVRSVLPGSALRWHGAVGIQRHAEHDPAVVLTG